MMKFLQSLVCFVLVVCTGSSYAQTFTSTPVTTATVGTPYTYSANASDPSNSPLTFTAPTLPSWLTFSATGQNTYTTFGGSITQPIGVAGDSNGNTYSTTYSSSVPTAIYKIAPDGTTTNWATRQGGNPYSMAVYNGYLYLSYYTATSGASKITKIDLNNPAAGETTVTTFSTNGACIGITFYQGDLYVAMYSASKIAKVNLATGTATDFVTGISSNPWGLGFDAAGRLYITTYSGSGVQKYAGGVLSTVLSNIGNTTDIKIDNNGYFYISSNGGGIRKYTPDLSSFIQVAPTSTGPIYGENLTTNGTLVFSMFSKGALGRIQTGAVLTGTPTTSDIGVHNVSLNVSNGTTTANQSFAITVTGPSTYTAPSNIIKNYGDASFTIADPTSNSNGAFSYSSSNTAVATISGNTVNVVGKGTSTITVTQAASGLYLATSKTFTITVNAIAPTLTGFANIAKVLGNPSFTLSQPASNSSGAFTYTSSNTAVATISGSTVTINGIGTSTITANQAASGNYTAGSISSTLTVSSNLTGPANVNTGIKLWLDASDVNATGSNPSDGSAVTIWKDKSGAANNATILSGNNGGQVYSNQVNGKSTVRFTRADNTSGSVYEVNGVDIRAGINPDVTIFTVYKPGSHGSELQGLWGNDNGAWDRFYLSHWAGDDAAASLGPIGTNVKVVPNGGKTGELKLLTAVYDGTVSGSTNSGPVNGSTIYFNGQSVVNFTDSTDPFAAQTNLRIGKDGDDNPYNGDIAEMIVYDRKLTDCEIQTINQYLSTKYAVSFTTASIAPSGSISMCDGSSTTLTASAGTSYQWYLNGSPINGATSGTYVATLAGNYTVTITSAGGCSASSAATTLNINPPVTATITASGATTICPSGSVTLTANNGTGFTYQWTKDGNPISGQTAVDYTASTSGSYNVIVTANGCTATASPVAITVSDTQAPVLTGVPSNTTVESDAIPAQAVVTANDNCVAGSVASYQLPVNTTKVNVLHNYSFENNFTDSKGTANGTNNNNVSFAPGIIGTAASFDGTNRHIGYGTTASLGGTANFAVSVWIKTSSSAPQAIIQQRDGNFNGQYMLFVGSNHGGDVLAPGKVYFTVYNNGFQFEIYSTTRVDDGKWHHIVAERDGTAGRISIDGVLNASATGPLRSLDASIGTYVGRDVRDGSKNFNGLIDELKIFSGSSCANAYDLERTWSVADQSGNQTAAQQLVSVVDTKAPVLSAAPANLTTCPTAIPAAASLTATDNGAAVAVVYSQTSTQAADATTPGYYNYTITRKWTATDACANVSSKVQVITVQDNIAPQITSTQANTIIALNETGIASLPAYTGTVTATDNCSAPSEIVITQSPAPGTPLVQNVPLSVTLTATDRSGLNASQVFTVTATDQTAPLTKTKNITVQLDALGKVVITPSQIDGGTTDNSGNFTLAFKKSETTTNLISNGEFNSPLSGWTTVGPYIEYRSSGGNPGAYYVLNDVGSANSDPGLKQVLTGLTVGKVYTIKGDYRNAYNCCGAFIGQIAFGIDIDGHQIAALPNPGTNWAPFSLTFTATSTSHTLGFRGEINGTDTDIAIDNISVESSSATLVSSLPFDCSNIGVNTVTLLGSDASGNISTATADVTVEDTIAPVIVNNGNKVVNTDENICGAHVVVSATVTDNCSVPLPTGKRSDGLALDAIYPVGTTTITWTAKDIHGNDAITSIQTVTVEDHEAPIAVAQNITVWLDALGHGSTTAALVNNGSTDACGIKSISLSKTEFDCSSIGNNTVTLTVTDIHDNVSTIPAIVTVVDSINPIAIAQNITVQLDSLGHGSTTAALVNNGSSDACGIESTVLSKTDFDCSNFGANPVTLTVTDIHGNVSTASAVVTVEDHIVPVAIAQNITLQLDASGHGSTTAEAVNNGSSDACGIASLVLSKTNFDCSNSGSNPVILTVTDIHGNVSTANAVITVEDHVAPVAKAQNVTVQLDASGHGSTTAEAVNNGSFDACGIESIVLSKTNFDCSNFGENNVTLTLTDIHGNISTANAVVTVEDHVAPVAKAQNVTVQLDASGHGSTTAEAVNNGSSDACGIESIVLSKTTFDCSNFGENTITLTVTDIHGNVATANAVVTVEDHIAPAVLVKNITIQLNSAGTASITPAQINNGSSDACGIASYSLSKSSFDCSNVGVNTITFTVTDIHGNISSQNATVTVQDNIAPTVITKTVSITLAGGAASITPASINKGSFDNCGIKSMSLSKSSFDCDNLGNNTVILTVTDNNGNVSSAPAIVKVIGVHPTPSIAVSRTDNTFTGLDSKTIALGYGAQSLTLTASNSTSATGATSYKWYPVTDLSSSTAANPVFTPTSAGTYTYSVTATNEFGCVASTSVTITVLDVRCGNKNEKVLVCHKTGSAKNPWEQICISANAVDVQLRNGGTLGTCSGTQGGTIASVTQSSEVLLSSSQFADDVLTVSRNVLSAYPNPFATNTTVTFTLVNSQDKVSLDLWDMKGAKIKNIYSGAAKGGEVYNFPYDATNTPSGTYFFKLITSKEVLTFKVIIVQ